jgi:hypothetical protein
MFSSERALIEAIGESDYFHGSPRQFECEKQIPHPLARVRDDSLFL